MTASCWSGKKCPGLKGLLLKNPVTAADLGSYSEIGREACDRPAGCRSMPTQLDIPEEALDGPMRGLRAALQPSEAQSRAQSRIASRWRSARGPAVSERRPRSCRSASRS